MDAPMDLDVALAERSFADAVALIERGAAAVCPRASVAAHPVRRQPPSGLRPRARWTPRWRPCNWTCAPAAASAALRGTHTARRSEARQQQLVAFLSDDLQNPTRKPAEIRVRVALMLRLGRPFLVRRPPRRPQPPR
jgi:hypothetical protein